MSHDMPILPDQRRPLHDDTPVLLPAVHRADAYQEITEARRKLDDERERQISARDTNKAPTAEGCRICAMPLPGAYDFNCTDCLARMIFKTRCRAHWGKSVRIADTGRQQSIADELMKKLHALETTEIDKVKSSHKGEWA